MEAQRRFSFARRVLTSAKGRAWLLAPDHCALPSAPSEQEFGCMLYKVPREVSEIHTPPVAYIPNYESDNVVYGTTMTEMFLLQGMYPTDTAPAPCRRFMAFPFAKDAFALLESTHLSNGELMMAITISKPDGTLLHYTYGLESEDASTFKSCVSITKGPDCGLCSLRGADTCQCPAGKALLLGSAEHQGPFLWSTWSGHFQELINRGRRIVHLQTFDKQHVPLADLQTSFSLYYRYGKDCQALGNVRSEFMHHLGGMRLKNTVGGSLLLSVSLTAEEMRELEVHAAQANELFIELRRTTMAKQKRKAEEINLPERFSVYTHDYEQDINMLASIEAAGLLNVENGTAADLDVSKATSRLFTGSTTGENATSSAPNTPQLGAAKELLLFPKRAPYSPVGPFTNNMSSHMLYGSPTSGPFTPQDISGEARTHGSFSHILSSESSARDAAHVEKPAAPIVVNAAARQNRKSVHGPQRPDHDPVSRGRVSKQHACALCSRAFTRVSHLKDHVRAIHEQTKPHSCGQCGKSFSARQNLYQHLRHVHKVANPFVCEHCKETFMSTKALRSHELAGHNISNSCAPGRF
ncbi:C2H2 finger domain transcription factor sebA [Porphyridium purpureum]|uniref:C2H2 finger domain transcription factor sebA n=1 Tax=Porphyridium purpureum TaxID=35688 RepID=A0A5J4YJ41_PORPP|nr:C2H2 finger domain transcription factor sebA [Porphyridium purpureum]|eukprot:POR8951..scf261_15